MATGTNYGTTGVFNEKLSGDDLTKFMRSQDNQLANTGAAASQSGKTAYGQGLGSLGPVLSSLSRLVNGDQADVTQAIQPEANRIKDSFSAVRQMISQQPRGGGKAGVLAEAPYKQEQQIQDTATGMRQNATGQLGSLSATLAGLGLSEQQVGQQGSQYAAQNNLERRNQNFQDSTMNNVFKGMTAAGQMMQGVGALY